MSSWDALAFVLVICGLWVVIVPTIACIRRTTERPHQ